MAENSHWSTIKTYLSDLIRNSSANSLNSNDQRLSNQQRWATKREDTESPKISK